MVDRILPTVPTSSSPRTEPAPQRLSTTSATPGSSEWYHEQYAAAEEAATEAGIGSGGETGGESWAERQLARAREEEARQRSLYEGEAARARAAEEAARKAQEASAAAGATAGSASPTTAPATIAVATKTRLPEQPPPPRADLSKTRPDVEGGQVATVGGVRYYLPGHTMYRMGYATVDQYVHNRAPYVTVRTHTGQDKHITVQEAQALYDLHNADPESYISQLSIMGIIPEESTYIGGTGDSIRYITGEQEREIRRQGGEAAKSRTELAKQLSQYSPQEITEIRSERYKILDYDTGKFVSVTKREYEDRETLYRMFPEAGAGAGKTPLPEAVRSFEKSHLRLADGKWISVSDWNAMFPDTARGIVNRREGELQHLALNEGYDAMAASLTAEQARYDTMMSRLDKFAIREPLIGPLREGESRPDVVVGYDVAGYLRRYPSDRKLVDEFFPKGTSDSAVAANRGAEASAKSEELYQSGKNVWVNTSVLNDGSLPYTVRITTSEIRQLRGSERDKFVRDQPALILPADPDWQKLKDRPRDDPERQAYLRQWQDKVIDAATFASLAAMPYTMGAIGVAGKTLTVPKVATWAFNIGKVAIKPVAIASVVINPVVRAATSLAKLANLYPAVLAASRIGDQVLSAQLQSDWQSFQDLPDTKKNEWANQAGYGEPYDNLTDEQKATVLVMYSAPPDATREQWMATMGEKLQELTEYAGKGSAWLQKHSPSAVSNVVSVAGGLGVGIIEGLGYQASIPLLAANLAASVPIGTAPAYAAQTVQGMARFFATDIPAAFVANPSLATGRMAGLFLLSPKAALKLAKGLGARSFLRYVPERAMATEYHTLRIRFDRVAEFAAKTPADRMRIAEDIVSRLLKGEKKVTVEGVSATIEVKNVPYQEVIGNTLWNFSDRPLEAGSKLYTSPQAAVRFAVITAGGKAINNAVLNEIRVPDNFQPKMEKLLSRGEAELESIFGKNVRFEPIQGWTGKGISTNVATGPYRIRRFTLLGEATTVRKLTPAVLAKLRLEAGKAALGDLVKGWSGRTDALKSLVRIDPRLDRINAAIYALQKSKPETLAGTGEIVTPRPSVPHPSGRSTIKPRVTAIVKNSRGQVMLVKDVTESSFGLPGGQVDIKWKTGQLGFRRLPDGRHVLTPEGAAHGQVKSETGVGLDRTRYVDTYMGKVNEYALSGSRVFEADARTDVMKLKKSEIQDALWWDGKSDVTVYPATYDILKAVADRYELDMTKVRVDQSVSILNKSRDTKFYDRVKGNRTYPKDVDPARLNNIEIKSLRRQKYDIARGPEASIADYLNAEGDLATLAELLHGRRKAVKITMKEPLRKQVDTLLLENLRKDASGLLTELEKAKEAAKSGDKAAKRNYDRLKQELKKKDAWRLLSEGKVREAVRAYEKSLSPKAEKSLLEILEKDTSERADDMLKRLYDDYGEYLYRPDVYARLYAGWLQVYTRAAATGTPISLARAVQGKTVNQLRTLLVPPRELGKLATVTRETPYPSPGKADATRGVTPEVVTPSRIAPTPETQRITAPQVPLPRTAPRANLTDTPPPKVPPKAPPPPPPPRRTRPRPPAPPEDIPTKLAAISKSGGGAQVRLPEGSMAWKQGWTWRWVPREDWLAGKATKPKALRKGVTPIGARFTDKRTPAETIQIIGDAGASVPDLSVDLGIADVFVTNKAQDIQFTGKGEWTNVGERDSSPTKGMSLGVNRPSMTDFYPQHSVSRLDMAKGVPMRKGKTTPLRRPDSEANAVAKPHTNGLGAYGSFFDETEEFEEQLSRKRTGHSYARRERPSRKKATTTLGRIRL